jgi:hypothetical protein
MLKMPFRKSSDLIRARCRCRERSTYTTTAATPMATINHRMAPP